MKNLHRVLLVLLLLVLIFPSTVLASSAVPQVVLDARSGLVRIFCYVGDDVYTGTGFAVGEEEPIDYIVTNYHVVEGGNVRIEVYQSEDKYVEASIYRKDEDRDLCVLKLDEPLDNMTPLILEDETEANTGDAIYTLGFPGAADYISGGVDSDPEDVTLTDGIISAVKSGPVADGGPNVDLIQINASLNPGNSGGPLLNESGYVIGINTFTVADAQNVNAAVSVEELFPILRSAHVSYLSPTQMEDVEPVKAPVPDPPAGLDTVWIVVIAVAAALFVAGVMVLIVVLKKRSSPDGKRMSFNEYFGDPYRPFNNKLKAAAALVEEIFQLHLRGQYGLDICPENITVEGDKAVLKVHRLERRPGALVPKPGYSAPELYGTQSTVGPWSDVYAVSAVLYAVVTGQTLPPAFSRREGAPVFQNNMEDRYIGLAAAVTAGLAVNYQRRPATCDPLLAQLRSLLYGLSAQPWAPPAEQYVQSQAFGAAPAQGMAWRPAKKRWSAKKKALVIPAICLVGILAVCGGLAVMCEVNYNRAVSLTEHGEYLKADENLQGVFIFYRDTRQLGRYIQGGIYIDNQRYDDARSVFAGLGDYRNSPEMILKTDYMEAVAQMEAGDFDSAEKAFEKLAANGYGDAEDMLKEVSYQRALSDIDDKQLTVALDELEDIGPYKDTDKLISQVKSSIYDEGMRLLKEGEPSLALEQFRYISGYKDADRCFEACGKLSAVNDVDTFTRDDYEYILGLDNIDISPYLLGDASIFFYLEGTWTGGDNSFILAMKDGSWSATVDLPCMIDGYFDLVSGVYRVYESDADMTGTGLYSFTYVSLFEVDVYCYGDGNTYRLYKK